MNFIVETNWINKDMQKGINEHYRSLKQACESIDGAEFIGLYKPLTDPWNWTHFINVDSLEKWRIVEKETHRLCPDLDNNLFYSTSRLYQRFDTGRQLPPIRDPESLKYLVMELSICKEVDLGFLEYYNQRCEQFEGLECAGLLGLYQPVSETWNWALIKLFDSMNRYMNVRIEYQKTYRRIPEVTNSIDSIYERHEP
jgi:hypothetical protein